ncbi:MAG: pseudaminic acid biosynthesis-associated methylase [Magnetococcales bacterium]|jgi:spore coat polysaccharide biosynthesis protein SpsF|nr:pseudaminic acid biosynthesis-associated methylase [Magnetococcales bacterium]|tara:strand:+ start:4371 stop:5000 length:630 start_codon:yes stop_codon:yes gene_type:complete
MPQANFKTEQETFWAGEFGDEYTFRNDGANMLAANASLFTKVFSRMGKPKSIVEFGCNQGMNLKAINTLLPETKLTGVEINKTAAEKLEKDLGIKVHNTSILDFDTTEKHDLAMIKGVLIHINPEELATVYDKLYAASSEYIFVCEYYNPAPVAIPYRGHDNKLFKRDFAGEILERFSDLELVDYGFCYRRDPVFPMDDVTWFLMRKTK